MEKTLLFLLPLLLFGIHVNHAVTAVPPQSPVSITLHKTACILTPWKFAGKRITYTVNSTASFRALLLKCGDINPNPGPLQNQDKYKFSCEIQ